MKVLTALIPTVAVLAIGFVATPSFAMNADGKAKWCQKRVHCQMHIAVDDWLEVFDGGHWWSCPPNGLQCIEVYRQSQIDNTPPLGGVTGFGKSHGGGAGGTDNSGTGGNGGSPSQPITPPTVSVSSNMGYVSGGKVLH